MKLSKSKILSGTQCEKRLWLDVHRPDLAEVSAGVEARLRAGTEVGVIARREWPDGILADETDWPRAIEATRAWIAAPDRPLFEGIFVHDDVRIRPDALVPTGDGSVDLYEVKSSTSVKPYHETDVTVQAWVLRQAGIDLRRVHLTHIDNTFVYPGDGDYRGLFTHADLTDLADANAHRVPEWISRFRQALSGDEPAIEVGPHCTDPFECPYIPYCSGEPAEYPVSILPRGGALVATLTEEGILDLREVPEERLTNPVHRLVHRATITGNPISNSAAAAALKQLGWPRYYLDFETVQFPVPIWPGSRPWQNLPFQWSCHIEYENGDIEHREFLGDPTGVPFEPFARSLIDAIGADGPVLVYNVGFERSILSTTGDLVPGCAPELHRIANRLVDLLPLTRESWYHPDQHGSWSLKAVLPTVAPDLDYHALEGVTHGGEAAEAISEYCHADTMDIRRAEIAIALRKYCELDTYAMVRLAHHLSGLE